ncbi:Fc.00g031900.m01.CDS01 [Cosmosporella sp. VM-42]
MAPELRKRRSVSDIQKPNGSTPKAAKAGKRKAAEDASPVSLKKQKAVKKTVVDAKPTKKSAKPKKQPVEEVKVTEEEETIEVPDVSESEEEENKEVQELLTKLDSEDEDITNGDSLFKPGQDVGKIPKVSKKDKKAAKDSDGESGVIYIGRIPHGFYEHEMRQYFEQFGPIKKLRLSRNKKTGASKHFAFVEFNESSAAEIVAKTMNNYLLFGHILKCKIIPKDQVREGLFKGANRRFKKVPWNKMAGSRLEKPLTESAWANKVEKEQSKRAKKAAKLKEIGYEFEVPEIKAVPAPAAIEPVEAEVKAIEDVPAEKEEEEKTIEAVEVTEIKAVIEEPEEPEVEVEVTVKSISAPKTKGKGRAKAGRGKKSKA